MTKFIVAKMSNPIKIKPNTTPEGKMSGQGDCSRALKWTFKTVIFMQWLYDFFGGKSHERFGSLSICLG